MGARDCLIGWPFTHTICFPFGLIALGFAPFGLVSSALSLGHRLIRSHRWMDLVDKLLSYMDLSFPFMRGFDVIVGECRPCPSLVLLELYCAFKSRGDLLKCRLWYRRLQGGTHDHAFLTSSQVTPRTRCVETILCFVKTCFKIIHGKGQERIWRGDEVGWWVHTRDYTVVTNSEMFPFFNNKRKEENIVHGDIYWPNCHFFK